MKNTQKPAAVEKKKFTFNNTMGILLVIIVFSLLIWTRSKEFISVDNFITVMRNCSVTILVGFGQMVVMAGGGLNVSIGSIGGLAAVIVGAMIQRVG